MRLIIISILFFSFSQLHADIFKCTKSDGSTYYYDRNCIASDVQEEITKRDLVLMRYEIGQKQEDIIKQKKNLMRQELIAEKLQAAEMRQRLRFETKCETVRQQIVQLNKRYKQGYTIKQGQALDRKLAECNSKRQIYCKK